MSTIDELAATVRGQLDADERLARELTAWADGTGRTGGGAFEFHRLLGDPLLGPFGGQSAIRNWGTGQDIAKLADPARVLRDVAAKRALVDRLLAEPHGLVDADDPYPCPRRGTSARCQCGRDERVLGYLELMAQAYREAT